MDASAAISSRLIGAIFVEKGLITPEQLERAMQLQEETGDRLGEVIVAEFGVARLELASVLAEQWAEFERTDQPQDGPAASPAPPGADEAPVEPQLRRPIGEIFVDRGFVTEEQLQKAVEVQSKTGQRIGEVLVEQGSLTRLDLASALAEQWSTLQKLRPPEPVPLEPGQADLAVPTLPEAPTALRTELADLENRVRIVERAAAASPWEGDLKTLSTDLRADLAALEQRLVRADDGTTISTEPLAAALAELRERVDAPSDRLEELERRLADAVTSDVLDARLVALEGLNARLDDLAQRATAPDGLDELRARVDGLAAGVAETAGLDTLTELRERVDAIADRLPGEGVVDEMRRALSELAARASDETAEGGRAVPVGGIVARLDQLAAQVEDLAAGAGHLPDGALHTEVAGLRARLDEVLARPLSDTAAADEPMDALERKPREVTAEEVAAVAHALEEQRSQFESRLGELSATAVAATELDDLRLRVDELARIAASADVKELDERIETLESRLADLAPVNELRDEVQRVAESAADERASLERALLARVDEITTTVPAVTEFAELRGRVNELAARPALGEGLGEQVAELAARLDAAAAIGESVETLRQTFATLDAARASDAQAMTERLAALEKAIASFGGLTERIDAAAAIGESVESLRKTFAALDVARANDSRATGERLDGIERALGGFDGLEERIRGLVAESDGALVERIDDAHQQLAGLGSLESRLADLRDDLAARADASALADTEHALRAELAQLSERLEHQEQELARRPETADQTERLDGIGLRLDTHARDMHGRLTGIAADVNARVDGLEARTDGLAGRDELERNLTERLGALAERSSVDAATERIAAVEGSLANGLRLLQGLRDETAARLEETVGALREDIEGRESRTSERIAAQQAALEARVDSRVAELSERLAAEASRMQSTLDHSAEVLRADAAGVHETVRAELEASQQALRVELENGRDTVRLEVDSLVMRIDELHALRHADSRAAREAVDALGARVGELHGLRAEDAEAAEAAVAEAGARLDKLAGSLRREAASAKESADRVGARLDELTGLREGDAESARAAAAELVVRLDDLALRTAAAAAAAERALRDELEGVAARLEEQDASGIEAREELRVELERVASSVGWRLERIEESLASDDSEALRAAVAEVERRLDMQVSQQDEQVRVTERALRKGLASLGERLVDSETAYVEAGTALRRSIERLGAAVVEADARMADQIPVAEVEGYVAFAPTAEGYRLVQMAGRPPALGALVEVDGCDVPLVVTRYGRSPLPLDSRSCAYLDRS